MRYATLLSAAIVTAAVAVVGCSDNRPMSGDGMTPMPANGKAVEGNPGATTGPSAGYSASDVNAYHPQSDDQNRYHPADPNAIRQQSGQ